MRQPLPHGGVLELDEDRPIRCLDRHGHALWHASWDGPTLTRLRLVRPTPARDEVTVVPALGDHPLFGPCGGIVVDEDAPPVAHFAALDWRAPERLVPIDRPAAIPGGAGTAMLNVIALLAARAGRSTLRYVGPYSTAALFDSLQASFRPTEDPATAFARFTDGALRRAVAGTMDEVPVDFVPAPHHWAFVDPRICCQLRDGLERVYVDGLAFDRDRLGHRRLVPEADTVIARIEIGGRPWADVARFAADGELAAGPHALPALTADERTVCGLEMPAQLVPILAEVLVERAAPPLADEIRGVLATHTIAWADTGAALGRIVARRLELHAVLGARLPELPPAAMLAHLATALEPLVQRLAQRRLAARLPPS